MGRHYLSQRDTRPATSLFVCLFMDLGWINGMLLLLPAYSCKHIYICMYVPFTRSVYEQKRQKLSHIYCSFSMGLGGSWSIFHIYVSINTYFKYQYWITQGKAKSKELKHFIRDPPSFIFNMVSCSYELQLAHLIILPAPGHDPGAILFKRPKSFKMQALKPKKKWGRHENFTWWST